MVGNTNLGALLLLPNFNFPGRAVGLRIVSGGGDIDNGVLKGPVANDPSGPLSVKGDLQLGVCPGQLRSSARPSFPGRGQLGL